MIEQFLSTQSRKAWVAGVLTALLQPIVQLLSGTGEITLRSVLLAFASGLLASGAVFSVSNDDPVVWNDEPGEHAAQG